MDKHYKDYIQIGLNIMRYRKEQGLTQDQLSEMAGYSRNHLQRVETAVCKPTVGLLLDVSEVLGVPVERLMEIRKYAQAFLTFRASASWMASRTIKNPCRTSFRAIDICVSSC